MNLLLLILTIFAVYIGIIAFINVVSFYATSLITSTPVRYSIRIIVAILSPFWLYIDLAIGLPLLKAACVNSGPVILEPFKGNVIAVNEGNYSQLPIHTGVLNENEYKNLTFYFSSPWGPGWILSSHDLASVKTYDGEYAKYWIADINNPSCIDTPEELKKIFSIYKNHCIAVETVKETYAGYVLNLKPIKVGARGTVGNNETLGWGLRKFLVTMEKHGEIVASATTYEFREWLKVPSLAESGVKKFYCGNQVREWDFIDEFIEALVASKSQ